MRKEKKHRILLLGTGLTILLLPFILAKLLYNALVSEFITETLNTDKVSFLELVLDYFSISITLLLGIVVYYQSERINNLEASQYKLFLGVEGLDYEFNFGDCFASVRSDSEFQISHMFTMEKKVVMSTINIEKGAGKTLLLPLVFVTKNNSLIVSVNFKQVSIIIKESNIPIYKRTFHNTGDIINAILRDDSHFVFGFGMVIPERYSISEINIQFYIELEDQNTNLEKIQSSLSLYKSNEDGDFVLTSSRSKYV